MNRRAFRLAALAALLALTAPAALSAAEPEELSSTRFLEVVRRPPGRDSWALMTGKVQHLRRGGETQEASLRLAVLFTPQRTLAQMVIGGREGYLVGQGYGAGQEKTSILPLNGTGYADPLLGRFGLRPEDLAMTFIFWKYMREADRDSFKGHECRVFLLDAPEDPGKPAEIAKVYLSAKYYFPLKVEWFREPEENPYRTLEVASFRKEDDFWLVSSMNIYGPGWRTRVEFTDAKAGRKDSAPRELFLPQDTIAAPAKK